MLEQLRELNALFDKVTSLALHLPKGAGANHDNEEEALVHAIAIRLGITERALHRAGIFPAKIGEDLRLEHRIQELAQAGIKIEELQIAHLDASFEKQDALEESYRQRYGPIPPITER